MPRTFPTISNSRSYSTSSPRLFLAIIVTLWLPSYAHTHYTTVIFKLPTSGKEKLILKLFALNLSVTIQTPRLSEFPSVLFKISIVSIVATINHIFNYILERKQII